MQVGEKVVAKVVDRAPVCLHPNKIISPARHARVAEHVPIQTPDNPDAPKLLTSVPKYDPAYNGLLVVIHV